MRSDNDHESSLGRRSMLAVRCGAALLRLCSTSCNSARKSREIEVHTPSRVVRELWVECGRQQVPRPHRHYHTLAPVRLALLLLRQVILCETEDCISRSTLRLSTELRPDTRVASPQVWLNSRSSSATLRCYQEGQMLALNDDLNTIIKTIGQQASSVAGHGSDTGDANQTHQVWAHRTALRRPSRLPGCPAPG